MQSELEVGLNLLKAIQVGAYGSGQKIELPLAYPKNLDHPFCVNVLCGRNNSGKSHILRELGQAFDSRNLHNATEKESINVHGVLLKPEAPMPRVLFLPDLTSDKSRLNTIPLVFKHDPKGRTARHREIIIDFIGHQLACVLEHALDEQRWNEESDYRLERVGELAERTIYRCQSDSPVIRNFEQAVGGKLYFGCKSQGSKQHLELALRYDDHRAFYFQNWSEGQKTLLTAFLAIYHHRPHVLLLDEIENHFHPEYITQLTRFLKELVPQTILVTHHPHVLFSKMVDRLFYLERLNEQDEQVPDKLKLPQGFRPRSPRRRISQLTTEFDRITAAYGLFDNQDRQLLALSQAMHESLDAAVTESLLRLFQPSGSATSSDLSALQHQVALTEVLEQAVSLRRRRSEVVSVLDHGVGRFKMLLGLLRETRLSCHGIRWAFWDLGLSLRRALQSPALFDVLFYAPSQGVPPAAFDLLIFSNLLHEKTPREFGDLLVRADHALRDDGSLVIIEPYPLIRPQKYSVHYSQDDMVDLLFGCGWKVESCQLAMPGNFIEAYCVLAHSPDRQLSANVSHIEGVVKSKWQEILARSCARYDGRRQIGSARDQVEVMGLLTTIASITNFNLGNWK